MLVVLVPLRLDDGGFTPLAIGAVFLAAGFVEVAVNPILGRFSDRRGRLLPIRVALAASIAVALAFAVARDAYAVSLLAVFAATTFGAFYTPGMALVSDRSAAGLSQAIGFGIMNTACAWEHERLTLAGGWRRPPETPCPTCSGATVRVDARRHGKALEDPASVERRFE